MQPTTMHQDRPGPTARRGARAGGAALLLLMGWAGWSMPADAAPVPPKGYNATRATPGRGTFPPPDNLPRETPETPDPAAAPAAAFRVNTAFPGGNGAIQKIEGDAVWFRPERRGTGAWSLYWNFEVEGAAGHTVRFIAQSGTEFGGLGPAVSRDGGRSWSWLGAASIRHTAEELSFHYAFAPNEEKVRFSSVIPYQLADLEAFLEKHRGNASLEVREHCRTRGDRVCPQLRVGKVSGDAAYRVALTARHHACESLASYVLEGVLEGMLAPDETGAWLRENVEAFVAPMVDLDGVERGEQGKGRRPWDHNRDYQGPGIYPEVRALREQLPAWSQGKLALALDLHCPTLTGPYTQDIYLIGSSLPRVLAEQKLFGRLLEKTCTGALPYQAKHLLPYGTAWNTEADQQDRTFAAWAQELPGIRLATTLEIPYARASGHEVNADSARAFGHDLAAALRPYLQTPRAEEPAPLP